jgi:hypothetical protein
VLCFFTSVIYLRYHEICQVYLISHIHVCEKALSRIKENKSSLYPTILHGTITDMSKRAQILILLHSNRITKFYNNKKRSGTYYNVQIDVGSSKVNWMQLRYWGITFFNVTRLTKNLRTLDQDCLICSLA